MAMTSAFQADYPGSSPGERILLFSPDFTLKERVQPASLLTY